jgi:ABC-type multidrug transport system ATPase subunit
MDETFIAFSSPDMNFVRDTCDRVALMRGEKIIRIGRTADRSRIFMRRSDSVRSNGWVVSTPFHSCTNRSGKDLCRLRVIKALKKNETAHMRMVSKILISPNCFLHVSIFNTQKKSALCRVYEKGKEGNRIYLYTIIRTRDMIPGFLFF